MPLSEELNDTNLTNQHVEGSFQSKQANAKMAVEVQNHQSINDPNKFQFVFSNANSFRPHSSYSHNNNNSLNYRQTFSAGTNIINASSADPQKRIKPKSKRSYLPLPPAIHYDHNANMDHQNQINGFFSSLFKNSSSSVRLTSANKIISNELQSNVVLKSDSFLSDSCSSNYDTEQGSPTFSNPPYIKYKKPPTYEESLKKIVSCR